MEFAKGHGTENDFVIIPDRGGVVDLTPATVARICDRRAGLGADGVLRVVAMDAMPAEVIAATPAPGTDGAAWFMDYRNADGSAAEMCGNGIRVLARYLLDHGLAGGTEFTIGTRAGPRLVREEPDGAITVEMGKPRVLGASWASVRGFEVTGLVVSVGNPHLACLVDAPLDGFDLTGRPLVDGGQFPSGVNVELVGLTGPNRIQMRVHERGSGETRSCGTGAVAAAAAAATLTQGRPAGAPALTAQDAAAHSSRSAEPSGRWEVQVPGGELIVTLNGRGSLLTGPAVIVAEGELSPALFS